MTLETYIAENGLAGRLEYRTDDMAVIHGSHDLPFELWHLSDWKVSSVSGGSVWLWKP